MSNIMELFFKDSRNHINLLVNSIIQFKKNPHDKSIIEDAFRAVHSIKTEASYLQLEDISMLSHEIESELDFLRTSEIEFSKQKYDDLVETTELLQEMIEMAREEALAGADAEVEAETETETETETESSDSLPDVVLEKEITPEEEPKPEEESEPKQEPALKEEPEPDKKPEPE